MSHYDISEWADFVRGLGSPDQRDAMAEHLAAKCRECASVVTLLDGVKTAAASDPKIQVPLELVTSAEAIFVPIMPAQPGALSRIVARLVYDSFRDLAVAGARSVVAGTQQMAFRAGDYYLDLRLDREVQRASLVGQFADARVPLERMEGLPVFLLSESKVLGRAVTNEFGEFCLEYTPRKNLRLCIPVEREGTEIEIPLGRFAAG